MSRNITISFLAQGYVNQYISLPDDFDLSDEEIIRGLNDGSILTTIQEEGVLMFISPKTGQKAHFGEIENVDNNLEYTDFEIRE